MDGTDTGRNDFAAAVCARESGPSVAVRQNKRQNQMCADKKTVVSLKITRQITYLPYV